MEIPEIFSTIPEYRQRDMCKYALSDILILSLLAELSGADDALEIVAYGREKQSFLQRLCPGWCRYRRITR